MDKLFEDGRNYLPDDPEVIEVMGSRTKQAQMRHHKTSPSYYRLGRKIIYRGVDLNAWAEAQRIEVLVA
ncbi:MerR family transcriptional regulator [Pseudohalocynthiibacter aestuariivivens]|uniref:MerR family transcriptional regulator n=1 Tax=Pseudohalocynthiibacter aestuariivivens TaxID=1591409 RepID=A0ABV5JCT5_9RHOB|nr:MerR family transcriptional regulator [Pseudohalocynthiibacter aestuariivivens]MBS9717245.1 MerR family transcriptional regulator [Pseudohalocynthiibacter aestuariivivens]